MSSKKYTTHLNLSSVTTSDPSNHSLGQKSLKKSLSSHRSSKKTPKNTPRSTDSLSLIHSFASFPSIPPNLSPVHLSEINKFRAQKIKEYKETLESCLNSSQPSPYVVYKQEKIQRANKDADLKTREIIEKRETEEIMRLKQSQSLKLSTMYYRMAKASEKANKEKLKKERIEKSRIEKEKRKKAETTKGLVIENIRNFYRDRIDQLKEKIMQERMQNSVVKFEQKKVISELEKERKLKNKVKQIT